MHNRLENDYSVICDVCGSDELCEHEDVEFCHNHCPKCLAVTDIPQPEGLTHKGIINKELLLD